MTEEKRFYCEHCGYAFVNGVCENCSPILQKKNREEKRLLKLLGDQLGDHVLFAYLLLSELDDEIIWHYVQEDWCPSRSLCDAGSYNSTGSHEETEERFAVFHDLLWDLKLRLIEEKPDEETTVTLRGTSSDGRLIRFGPATRAELVEYSKVRNIYRDHLGDRVRVWPVYQVE